MDLFLSAGIILDDGGRGGRRGRSAVGRTLRIPLLNYKVVAEKQKDFTFDFSPQQVDAARSYAKTAGSARFAKLKETEVRNLFCQKILGGVLGYTPSTPNRLTHWPSNAQNTARRGRCGAPAATEVQIADDEIVAPFELKGPTTPDLDAIMPGRGYSPVQQAWNSMPSTCPVADGCWCRTALKSGSTGSVAAAMPMSSSICADSIMGTRLKQMWLLLSAKQLLSGATKSLLRQSDSAYKDITDELYKDYSKLRERLLSYLTDAAEGPRLAMSAAIEIAQKLLDRILFVAFAERTDLLPDKLIERAAKARNEWRPEPYWNNFLAPLPRDRRWQRGPRHLGL